MSTTVKKEVISWVKTILLAAVLAGLVNSFLIVNAEEFFHLLLYFLAA